MTQDRSIVICVHDVTPRHRERIERIDELLGSLGVGARYAMLVVPNFWGQWPLDEHREFCDWLAARAADGVEMILHGYYHEDRSTHRDPMARWKSQFMTAREGEFLGLDYDEASRLITEGRTIIEKCVETRVDGFVAPAWLYSEGTRRALHDQGLSFAEDHLRVWRPTDGRVVHRSPVVSYASRDARRVASSLVWSRLASVVLRPLPVVRHAIHPHDLDVPALETEIVRSLRDFLTNREPVSYASLAA